MAVRIFCKCGTDVTSEISLWDRKTRTLFWMDQNPPRCARCRTPHAVPAVRDAEARKKVAAR